MPSSADTSERPVAQESVRILLVDDNPHDRVLLERELALHFPRLTVEHVRAEAELDAALSAGAFDLAITDYRLRWADGAHVLRQIKVRWPTRPVIMFTASGNEEIAAAAMKEGLDDYITKTVNHFVRVPYAVSACLQRAAQKQALEAAVNSLRESEARFRQMAESMPQILYLSDANGVVQYVSDRWREYTGFASASREVYAQLIPERDRERMWARWEDCRASGEAFEAEFRMRRRSDGADRWFLTRALPMRGEDGRISGWIGTSTDIHDQKRAAEELRDADRRKDEFLAILAHELRNPLAPIRNAVQFLRLKGPADAHLRNAHDIIDRQVEHLVRLVDDLLDVSRVTLGKVTLQKQPVNLADVISIALESVRPLLEASGHRVNVSNASEPLYVYGDAVRLSQVFTNLLSNAAKYTPSGGRISVRVERDRDDALIGIRDSGIGIPPEMLERIFELFSQVKSPSVRIHEGLGIGLTLARQLVRMHGGTIIAHSEGDSRGSEFIVRLPIHKQENTATPKGAHGELQDSKLLARRRLLVVDDNRDAADSLARLLELCGCEVCTVYTGRDAIAMAREFGPDAILLDIGMPQPDGHQVCGCIRKAPGGEQVVIVALTGWGQEADRRRTEDAGFDAHLVKPVNPDSAVQLLGDLLNRRGVKPRYTAG